MGHHRIPQELLVTVFEQRKDWFRIGLTMLGEDVGSFQ